MASSSASSNAISSSTTPTPSQSQSHSQDGPEIILKANSNDVGWEFGHYPNPTNKDKVKCNFCGKVVSGGIYRLKNHIVGLKGNVRSCTKASADAITKCKANLEETSKKKSNKGQHDVEVRNEVSIEVEDDDELKRKRPHFLGPIDKYAIAINPDNSKDPNKRMRQQAIHDALSKEKRHQVNQYCARWVYESGIPFHAIDNDSFKRFVHAIGQFGPGYVPPSQYELREPLLKEEVAKTKECIKKQEEEWAKSGCSIMTDGWIDRKKRSVMNLCVNCKEGTTFLSSKEDSNEAHTGEYIFNYVDKCIEEVGPQHVVQVVTDNASNNMAAAKLLLEKRPAMFWTSCATHTINLMLEAIGKQPRFKGTIEKAKTFTKFVYAHHNTLAMMRRCTKRRDIVRPGVTRFATSFLTLQSLMEKKEALRNMFNSEEWEKSKWSKHIKGIAAYKVITSLVFWNGVNLCLAVFGPLVKVLRLVDGDRKPSMAFLHGDLMQAKEEIKLSFKGVEANYRPIIDIINSKAPGRLDSPLHLTAYLLNPLYFYKDPSIIDDPIVMESFLLCTEKFHPNDVSMNYKVTTSEFELYSAKRGAFGMATALNGCSTNDNNFNPVAWWNSFGFSAPNLKKMAIRILSLTSSSSGCERAWSTFEGIQTKKRNRLDSTRLNNLVYVQFNAKIINKKQREKDKGVDILLANEASKAQSWIVDCDEDDEDVEEAVREDEDLPRRSARSNEVRELHDEEFESEEENEGVDEIEFESDDERIVERYGEEEIEA